MDMWIGVQIASYASLLVGYALLLVLAVRHRLERGRAQRLLEAALVVAGLWTLGLALMAFLTSGYWWDFVWHLAAQLGLVVLTWLTAEFADVYVQRVGRRWLRLAVVAVLAVAALVVDFAPWPRPFDLSPLPAIKFGPKQISMLLLLLAWAIPTASAWGKAAWALRQAVGAKHRNRIRYLLIGLLGFTVGDLLVFIGGVPDVYVGLSARLLGFAVITWAILRYDLPDIRRLSLVVLRVVILAAITALLYLVFLLGAASLVSVLPGRGDLEVLVLALGLAVLLAAILDVTLSPRLHRFFDRTVLGQNYNVQRALRTFSQQVSLILDLDRLADTTLAWLQSTMGIERAAFILFTSRSDGQIELRVLHAIEVPLPPPRLFSADSRFVLHFRNVGHPLSQYDLDMLTWFQVMPADERQWLRGLGVDLYVPILVGETPVVLLALGPKQGGQPYSEQELEALTILAGQAATAVENARLVDDLRAVQDDIQSLDNELSETNRQLQRLDQTKADFVTIASHELRTPLSQIFGYSDVLASLQSDELGDSQVVQEFIGGISRGARRLKRVVDAMVDMSLIETGALKMHYVAIPLVVIVQNVIQTVDAAIEARNLTLTIENLSGLPYIMADSARLEQAFLSVVSNAVKFTPDGGEITITGSTGSMPPDGDYVQIAVADQGIGIDPEQQTLIFEKFYRPENPLLHSTDDIGFKGAGPGLGLAIARGIVEANGGRIWVESSGRDEEACPGSTFFLRFPARTPEE